MYSVLWLIRAVSATPVLLGISHGIPIPKFNGKERCAGFRLIHLLDPVGKEWFRGMWAPVPKHWDEHSM
eukprot:1996953-Heterocapsa_arctica.AAC.1